MFWRVTLDEPSTHAITPGFSQTVRPIEAPNTPTPDGDLAYLRNCMLDPATGRLMLTPLHLTDNHQGADIPWSQLTAAGNAREVQRSSIAMLDPLYVPQQGVAYTAGGFSATLSPGLALPSDSGVPNGIISSLANDTLFWMIKSNFNLADNEGWGFTLDTSTDELTRYANLLAGSWDDICIHLSGTGILTAWLYSDPNAKGVAANLKRVQQYQIAGWSDLLHRPLNIDFIPVTGAGLLIMLSGPTGPSPYVHRSNAGQRATTAFMLPWQDIAEPSQAGTNPLVLLSSAFTVGLSPLISYTILFHKVAYSTSNAGEALTQLVDVHYPPTGPPGSNEGDLAPTCRGWNFDASAPDAAGTVTAMTAIMTDPDNPDTDWSQTEIEQQFRLKITLATSDSRYTPFLAGVEVRWAPEFATRDAGLTSTAPDGSLVPGLLLLNNASDDPTADFVRKLEWQEDEYRQFNGTLTWRASSPAARRIAERGDCSIAIYTSPDAVNWTLFRRGFTMPNSFEVDVIRSLAPSRAYDVTFRFAGFEELLDESHFLGKASVASKTIWDACRETLLMCRQPWLPDSAKPADPVWDTMLAPTNTQNQPRWAPRENETGRQMLQNYLLLIRTETSEWFCYYDYAADTWAFAQKAGYPLSDPPVASDIHSGDEPVELNRESTFLKLHPERPECNFIQAYSVDGNAQPGLAGNLILSSTLVNARSIDDPTSIEWLGRAIAEMLRVPNLTDANRANLYVSKLAQLAFPRRLRATVKLRGYDETVVCPSLAQWTWQDGSGDIWYFWVKRRTIEVEQDNVEWTTLELDTVWQGDIG